MVHDFLTNEAQKTKSWQYSHYTWHGEIAPTKLKMTVASGCEENTHKKSRYYNSMQSSDAYFSISI
jgi:hypothetical protein